MRFRWNEAAWHGGTLTLLSNMVMLQRRDRAHELHRMYFPWIERVSTVDLEVQRGCLFQRPAPTNALAVHMQDGSRFLLAFSSEAFLNAFFDEFRTVSQHSFVLVC